MQRKQAQSMLSYLVFFSQFGLMMILPPMCGAAAGWWLTKHFALGNWIVVVGILLGVGSAGVNLWKFARYMQRRAKESERDKRQ